MSVLQGTNINPSPDSSEAVRTGLFEKPTQEELAVREGEYRKWKNFLETAKGEACQELAQVFIDQCSYDLSLSLPAFLSRYSMPYEAVNEARAEIRGQKFVWDMILHRPDEIKGLLAKLEKNRETKDEKPAWQPVKK